ncbi:PaaI family thioesterase [Temperatibacter marinus]|uniref:PaaI family thioesterase n=1 Tax=Temperatibacter marinus TaxID=1456591 RepID=A0AA52EE11_9PROT|nr:PaaI family thioesterase [Temperatibacter marinus]WND01948.1 PaaI family thioesterase [Temperatibacter marinus]
MATQEEVIKFLEKSYPHLPVSIRSIQQGTATIAMEVGSSATLRPGGTVNGPTMMMMADVALYIAIQGMGELTLMAVTSSLNFNFLRRPSPDAALIAEAKILKMGRNLAVGEVTIFSEGDTAPVCHATGSYALPQKSS